MLENERNIFVLIYNRLEKIEESEITRKIR